MAPRKKRGKAKPAPPKKGKSAAKSPAEITETEESPDLQETVPTPAVNGGKSKENVNVRRVSPRQHKKFGKFRYLLEDSNTIKKNAKLEGTENRSLAKDTLVDDAEESKMSENSLENEELPTKKLQESSVSSSEVKEEPIAVESIVIDQSNESMDCADMPVNDTELSEQLSNLDVNSVVIDDISEMVIGNVEIAECDESVYIDNVEADITVECSSEVVEIESDNEVQEEIQEECSAELEEDKEIEEDVKENDENQEVVKEQEVEKKQKPKPKKVIKKKPITKATKSKMKTVHSKIANQKSKNVKRESLDSSIRRSSRIKSISVLKQRTKGCGLVKSKSDSHLNKYLDSESSENSNSGVADAVKVQETQASNAATDNDKKPVKVKSRWRRSSELEMSSSSPSNVSSPVHDISAPTQTSSNNTSVTNEKARNMEQDEEVVSRLKQFVHLKENYYLTDRISCKEAKKMTCDCFLTEEEIERGEYGCGEDCLNRLLMIECGNLCPVGDRCTNKRFQKSQFAPCEVFRTEKKGLGIKASADIPFGEFLLEYVGEVLDPEEFENRAAEYSQDKNQHYYFMSLRADAVIDATQKGNISRFINHSCDPNAETQKWTVNGELRIGFFSKRMIAAGEEITFDYQFQRYGKEAQKCYCEAATCRGWLGEEPDDDDEEEEEEDEEEEEEEEEQQIEQVVEKNEKEEVQEEKIEIKVDNDVDIAKEAEKAEVTIDATELVVKVEKPKPVKKEKKKLIKRKPRKDLFEDLDLDDEIESLVTTGLKNQAHTLKLSRLMVRAKEPPQRSKLLKLLRHGELPCRRLFLDYHGLRLMHGWMTDAQHLVKVDKKFECLRLEILQTLATLPIPNKTMLQDSKVLSTVEKWSVSDKDAQGSPTDSDSNSPNVEVDETENCKNENVAKVEIKKNDAKRYEKRSSIEKKLDEKIKKEVEIKETFIKKDEEIDDEESIEEFEIRHSVGMDIQNLNRQLLIFPNHSGKKLIQELLTLFDDLNVSMKVVNEMEVLTERARKLARKIPPPTPQLDYEVEVLALAIKLLEEWSSLKEVFRIPKKERIEQMKEHEREADKKYKALLGLEQENERKNLNRYRNVPRHRPAEKPDSADRNRKVAKVDDRNTPKFNKHERRQLFAKKVEYEEEERRRKQWQQNMADSRYLIPVDTARSLQYVWNPQTGQWQAVALPTQGSVPHYPYPSGSIMPPSYPFLPQSTPQAPPLPLPHTLPPLPSLHPPVQAPLPALPHPSAPKALPTPPIQHIPSNPVNNLPPLPTLPYQECIKEKEDLTQVKFMGPIPPPVKLPRMWKCAKDKYGRPYYYHIKIRQSQWEPPEFPPPPPPDIQEELSDSTSSSDSSSASSDTSSDDSESEDEADDTKLLLEIRHKLAQTSPPPEKKPVVVQEIKKVIKEELSNEEESSPSIVDEKPTEIKQSIDERLKQQFNLLKNDESDETPSKKRRVGLVQEIIISPRTEEDRLQFKEDLKRYKENKLKLKQERELIMLEAKRQTKSKATAKVNKKHKITVKTKIKQMRTDMNSEAAKKIKEAFRSNMAGVMVGILNAYRKPECKEGRITNTEDFKHLARKLTHFVMLKEIKHCEIIEDLTCTESVKAKAKEFVRKYMSKFGKTYQRPKDDLDNF